jgi:hypothetical protein
MGLDEAALVAPMPPVDSGAKSRAPQDTDNRSAARPREWVELIRPASKHAPTQMRLKQRAKNGLSARPLVTEQISRRPLWRWDCCGSQMRCREAEPLGPYLARGRSRETMLRWESISERASERLRGMHEERQTVGLISAGCLLLAGAE